MREHDDDDARLHRRLAGLHRGQRQTLAGQLGMRAAQVDIDDDGGPFASALVAAEAGRALCVREAGPELLTPSSWSRGGHCVWSSATPCA